MNDAGGRGGQAPPRRHVRARGRGLPQPRRRMMLHGIGQPAERGDVQRRHHGMPRSAGPGVERGVHGVIVNDVEPANLDRRAGTVECDILDRRQFLGIAPQRPGQASLVMTRNDRRERQRTVAVTAGEQRNIVPAIDQRAGQQMGVRFHTAHERRGDWIAEMGDDGDTHGIALRRIRSNWQVFTLTTITPHTRARAMFAYRRHSRDRWLIRARRTTLGNDCAAAWGDDNLRRRGSRLAILDQLTLARRNALPLSIPRLPASPVSLTDDRRDERSARVERPDVGLCRPSPCPSVSRRSLWVSIRRHREQRMARPSAR